MDEEALQERWAIYEKFIGQMVQSLAGCKNDKNNKKSKGSVSTSSVVKVKSEAPKVKKVKFTPSPVIEDGNFIFSKFDLLQNSQEKVKKEDAFKKVRKDKKLKSSLHKIQKQEEQVKKLIQKGETDKAIQLNNKKAWNNALEKAEGKKIFDDPKRIANSLKKHKKVKQKHAKEWAQRKKQVEGKIKKKQEKRERNINKMKMNKKKNKKNKKR